MNLNFFSIARDKVEMAWRHKSKDEKMLMRIILFLCIALIAFITTVAILDTTYKHEISDLKEEIEKLRQAQSTTADTDNTEETDTSSVITTPEPSITTTVPPTISLTTSDESPSV